MKRFAILALSTFLPWACKPEDGKKTDPSTEAGLPAPEQTKTEEGTDTNTKVETGEVAVDLFAAPSKMMAAMGSAMVSVAEVKNADGVNLNPGTVAVSGALALTDEPCKHSGGPAVQAATGGENAAMSAYCDLAKHPDGPDTTLGGIDRVQGLLCAIEGKFQYDGKDTEVLIELSDKCFSPAFVAMAKEMGLTAIKHIVNAKDGVDPKFGNVHYKKSIDLKPAPGEEEGFAYKMQLSEDNGTLSAAVAGLSDAGDEYVDAFAIALKTSAPASIRYEGRFAEFKDSDAPKGRHLRVFAKGTYDDAKKSFTGVEGLEYLYWDVFADADYLKSVKGSPTTGYKAVSLSSTPSFVLANYVVEPDDTLCYGGSCTGNTGLIPTTEADFAFAKHAVKGDADFVEPNAWFLGQGPLAFESVTFAE